MKILRAPSLVVGAKPSRWGHPYQVVWRFSAHSIGTKVASVHLSLVTWRWGLPLDRNEICFGYLVGIPSGWGLASGSSGSRTSRYGLLVYVQGASDSLPHSSPGREVRASVFGVAVRT